MKKKLSHLEEIYSLEFLKKSWFALNKGNKFSFGPNQETLLDFQNNLEKNIIDISNRLKSGTYKLGKVRGVLIKKGESVSDGFRPLRVSDIRDRLVLKAVSIKLNDLLSDKYNLDNTCSFAYRKNKGVEDAIIKMVKEYKLGKTIILEADIEKFFDTVDKESLLKMIFNDLGDDTSLNDIIKKGLSQEVSNMEELSFNAHYFEGTKDGIPQGNALSPLLANIYLANFDDRMIKEKLSLIRYADDFIVMCKDREEAERAFLIAKEEIEDKLKLKLHPLLPDKSGKTKIVDPKYDFFKFLSVRFDGTHVWVDKSKIEDLKASIRNIIENESKGNLLKMLKKIKNLIQGWLSAFKFCDLERNFKEIDDYINIWLYKGFRSGGFHLRTTCTNEVKINRKTFSSLTDVQRKNSGVLTCESFLKTIERNNDF